MRQLLTLVVLLILGPLAFAQDPRPEEAPASQPSVARESTIVRDPSEHIQALQLKNGLHVYLAPSETATNVEIRVRVDAGTLQEKVGRAGVAHLLEHYVFKDAKMDQSMTYLEAIEENGGEGNAETEAEATTFFATMPPKKVAWMIETFGKILSKKVFTQAATDEAKKPVYLEIGLPGPMDYLVLAINQVWPDLAHYPDFWETEFSIAPPKNDSGSDRITTESLTAEDLKSFYDNYYHAGNMTVFVAGKFDVTQVTQLLEETFGSLPARPHNGYENPKPIPRMANYIHSTSTSETPSFEVGTKMVDINLTDEVATEVYLDFLAHRLMKEVRNVKGETYTARQTVYTTQKAGLATITMESPSNHYYENLQLVRDFIDRETRQGQIDETMFKDASDFYAKHFELTDQDSATMMALALDQERIAVNYPNNQKSLFKSYRELRLDTYKASLKKVFGPQLMYESRSEPPLFFRYEKILFLLLGLVVWSTASRFLFLHDFRHDTVIWVRKLRYPPAYALQLAAFAFSAVCISLASLLIHYFWIRTSFVQSSFVVSDYLKSQVELAIGLLLLQFCLGNVPRKLIISGRQLYLKSLGYRSKTIELSEIKTTELRSPLSLLTEPTLLRHIGFRFYYYDLLFWRPGILLRLKSGRYYFLGVTDPKRAYLELSPLTPNPAHDEPAQTLPFEGNDKRRFQIKT